MRKIVSGMAVIAVIAGAASCKKSDNNPTSIYTVANFAGNYQLTALTGSLSGLTANLYDSVPPCQKDNIIQLKTDMTASYVDLGIKCTPPTDSSGVWKLSPKADTIYIAGNALFIKSWDGKTLVGTSNQANSGFNFAVTSTFTKQ